MDCLRRFVCAASLMLAAGGLALPAPAVTVYEVDGERSDLHWRVYSAGAFARLGHNHVISVRSLRGEVRVPADPAAAEWSLAFYVDDLAVDDLELRARYGEEFSSEPSARDVAGTRGNMLGERVLNAAEHPAIRIEGAGLTGPLDDARLAVTVQLLGRSVELELPARISIENGVLSAEGDFSLEHAGLGMEPFRVLMGALQVGERLDFSYRIHAVARSR